MIQYLGRYEISGSNSYIMDVASPGTDTIPSVAVAGLRKTKGYFGSTLYYSICIFICFPIWQAQTQAKS